MALLCVLIRLYVTRSEMSKGAGLPHRMPFNHRLNHPPEWGAKSPTCKLYNRRYCVAALNLARSDMGEPCKDFKTTFARFEAANGKSRSFFQTILATVG